MAYWTGKFETLGSNFRHETTGLLPSSATIAKILFINKITSYQIVFEYPHLLSDLDVPVLVLHLR